ncbi:hypothetical protein GMD78_10555 [Ornithinibacillus sp. L9]|uniref:Uncharacterized protein n=1 Tax=Ornithinibacillus caprae TaxID=2678566 RepID=A0A6N8FHB9_9BACI|nr:hypothetical protein [Ornithinibacillus caprae]MUK88833.1 hypothetical protein [Ornithinibacillus caprae]
MIQSKKLILSLSLFIFLVIPALFIFVVKQGEFSKWNHTWPGEEAIESHEALYLGYTLHWDGITTPTIHHISFIKKDGLMLGTDDQQLTIIPYMETGELITGAIDEEYAISEGFTDFYVPVNDYRMEESELRLILKVQFKDFNHDHDIHQILIEYETLGLKQEQYIDFEGFVKKEDE